MAQEPSHFPRDSQIEHAELVMYVSHESMPETWTQRPFQTYRIRTDIYQAPQMYLFTQSPMAAFVFTR